ncbi:MAG: hypothetical protein IT377_15365 [Polyangiaceae bacterium]|nr:hypothetical protein [Polyangiaceae bacterium]
MTAVAAIGPAANPATVTGADPETVLAAVEQQVGDMQMLNGRSRAEQLSTGRKAALDKARKSLKEAMKKKSEGGFWSKLASKAKTVATVATVVAAAAAVGTGVGAPAGLALAAVACSAGSLAMKETGLDTKVASVSFGGTTIDLNLSDCVALAGVAFGGAGATSTIAADASAKGASGLQVACKVTEVSAQGVAVVATGSQAVFVFRAGDANARAVEHQADARQSSGTADEASSKIEEQVEVLRSAMDVRKKVRDAVSKIMEERHETMVRLLEVRA